MEEEVKNVPKEVKFTIELYFSIEHLLDSNSTVDPWIRKKVEVRAVDKKDSVRSMEFYDRISDSLKVVK